MPQLPKRRLSIPRTLVSLLPLTDGDDRFAQGFTQLVVLETCSLFISAGEMYRLPHTRQQEELEPLLVQSYVLDVCPLATGSGAGGDRAVVLTAEYSLLLCEPSGPEGSLEFAEIHESFVSEDEMHLSPARNAHDPIIVSDLDRGLVAVITHVRILVLTVQRSITDDTGAFKVKVLGSSLIDLALQPPPFKAEEEGKDNIEVAMNFAGESFVPTIDRVSIWGGADNNSGGGAGGTTAIACTGNGRWIKFYPIEKDANGVWSACNDEKPGETMQQDKVRDPFPPLFPLEVKQHRSWITAISSGPRTSLCATADAAGGILIWAPAKASNRPATRGKEFEKLVYIPSFCEGSVTMITTDTSNALWIADSTGLLVCALYNETIKVLERFRTIKLFCDGCGISAIQWVDTAPTIAPLPLPANATNALIDDNRGRLRATSKSTLTALECLLHDSISTILSTPSEPIHGRGHSSVIELCTVLPELELVVTAGCGDKAWIWDLQTCHLVATITSKDRFFTALCAFDGGFVPGGDARIITGHGNGHVHEFLLIYDRNRGEKSKGPQGGETSGMYASLAEASLDLSAVSGTAAQSIKAQTVVSHGRDSLDLIVNKEDVDVLLLQSTTLDNSTAGSVGQGDDNDGRDQNSNTAAAGGAKGFVCKVDYQSSSEYLPLPVTQILTSVLGFYHVFCYAQCCIVIHSWEDRRVLAQIQFDDALVEISALSYTEEEDLEEDSFTLVLQGRHNVKLLDAIRGQMLTAFDVGTPDASIITSALWDLPADTQEIGNTGNRRIIGFAVTGGPSAFVFGDMTGCIPLQLQEPSLSRSSSNVDRLVLGCRSFGLGCSPYACVWTMRSVFWLRFNLANALPEVLRVQEYAVPDEKIRVVLGQAIKLKQQANRVLVVLSDGTISIISM